MLRIGVDEAGLGPLLGPLVVAGCAFRPVDDGPDAAPFATDLRARLRGVVAEPGRRADGALVVGDSKAVFGPDHDLALLEVPVLAFAAAARGGRVPETLDELLGLVGADASERAAVPWYAGAAPRLPLVADADAVATASERLGAGLRAAAVRFEGFAADVVPEARLNREFESHPNKSDVLFGHTTGILDRLLRLRAPGEAAGAALDRHGGRRFYLAPLAARWPGRFAWAVEERADVSRYRVRLPDAEAEFRWVVGGDAAHVEISLASMLAKYLREAFMGIWNDYFGALCPGVGRTAGYTVDARRWLDATRTVREAAGVPDAALVRTR